MSAVREERDQENIARLKTDDELKRVRKQLDAAQADLAAAEADQDRLQARGGAQLAARWHARCFARSGGRRSSRRG